MQKTQSERRGAAEAGVLLVETTNIAKKYDAHSAVDKVNLHVRRGEVYGLIGKNGAGKTTLFKLLLGLSMPSGGKLSLFGESNKHGLRTARRRMGSFVGASFFPYLTARQNLHYYRTLKGVQKSNVDELLHIVGLKDDNKPFSAYSMGMKQRLGLAAALIGSPELIILDEPVNGLDPEGIVEIRQVIAQMNVERGITFIVSSHILSELEMVATTFGFIHEGKLIKEIDRKEVRRQEVDGLMVKVDQAEKALNLLRALMPLTPQRESNGDRNIELVGENRLLIRNGGLPADRIAKHLIDGGVGLFELKVNRHTLEDYFFELIGRE